MQSGSSLRLRRLTPIESVRVMADYSQFVIADSDGADLELLSPDDDSLARVDSGAGYAVIGAQRAPVEIRTHRLGSRPDAPGPKWEDVVEFSVGCSSSLIIAELLDDLMQPSQPIPAPTGCVSAREGEVRARSAAT